jgi:O-antigen/teichoic acid export membrane protein
VSAQATFAEWLTLNGPYALFTLRFGVGPGLIALNTGMQLLRVGLTLTRNFSEIALPNVSRAVLEKRGFAATRLVLAVLGISLAPVLVLSAVMVLREHWLFSTLLSKNNVMPAGAGLTFAVACLAGVGFQAGSHLVGYVGRPRDIRLFTIGAAVSFIGLAGYILLARPPLPAALWAVSIGVVASACVGLWTIVQTLRAAR